MRCYLNVGDIVISKLHNVFIIEHIDKKDGFMILRLLSVLNWKKDWEHSKHIKTDIEKDKIQEKIFKMYKRINDSYNNTDYEDRVFYTTEIDEFVRIGSGIQQDSKYSTIGIEFVKKNTPSKVVDDEFKKWKDKLTMLDFLNTIVKL